jgi:AcrR family transcriptional regulator
MTSAVPVRLTRAQSRQRTRDLLVAAAIQVFTRDGYAGASVDAIAAQAGFTVGALYSNFATKHELFLAVFEAHCADEVATLAELAHNHPGADALLAAVTEQVADLDQAHRDWWTLWAELWLYAQRNPDLAARLAAVQAQTRALIAAALAPAGPELAAAAHALWTGFMMCRLVDPQAVPADTLTHAVRWLLAGQAANTTPTDTGGRP